MGYQEVDFRIIGKEAASCQREDPLGWRHYYQIEAVGLRDHFFAYEKAADCLKEGIPGIFEYVSEPTLVLGGFHPFCGTPESFRIFCDLLSPEKKKMVLLDQNATPLKAYKESGLFVCRQARIENWVCQQQKGSINGLILDCTTDFMTDSQVEKMVSGLANSLADNGLVWVFNYLSLLPKVDNLRRTVAFGVRHYQRELSDLWVLLLSELRPLLSCHFEVERPLSRIPADLLVLTSKKSSLPHGCKTVFFPIKP